MDCVIDGRSRVIRSCSIIRRLVQPDRSCDGAPRDKSSLPPRRPARVEIDQYRIIDFIEKRGMTGNDRCGNGVIEE